MSKTIEIKKVHIRNLFFSLVCITIVSCFKETKEPIKEKPTYYKEEISLTILNEIIYYNENEFRDWCKAQNYKYQFSDNADNYCAVQYANSDESEAVLINIPKNSDIKYNISYHTSNYKKYESILNELKKANYRLKSESEDEIEYYKVDSKVVININNILNEKVYSIDLYKNR